MQKNFENNNFEEHGTFVEKELKQSLIIARRTIIDETQKNRII